MIIESYTNPLEMINKHRINVFWAVPFTVDENGMRKNDWSRRIAKVDCTNNGKAYQAVGDTLEEAIVKLFNQME